MTTEETKTKKKRAVRTVEQQLADARAKAEQELLKLLTDREALDKRIANLQGQLGLGASMAVADTMPVPKAGRA